MSQDSARRIEVPAESLRIIDESDVVVVGDGICR